MSNKQIHIYFSGDVQGVGFRLTAERFASDLGVKGWVKNLYDGRVEIRAEAEEDVLKDYLNKLHGYFAEYIQDLKVEWLVAIGEFSNFRIIF